MAVARQIGVAIYHMLSRGQNYSPPKSADPSVIRRQRQNHLVRELNKIGFEVTCTPINK